MLTAPYRYQINTLQPFEFPREKSVFRQSPPEPDEEKRRCVREIPEKGLQKVFAKVKASQKGEGGSYLE